MKSALTLLFSVLAISPLSSAGSVRPATSPRCFSTLCAVSSRHGGDFQVMFKACDGVLLRTTDNSRDLAAYAMSRDLGWLEVTQFNQSPNEPTAIDFVGRNYNRVFSVHQKAGDTSICKVNLADSVNWW